MASLSRRTVLAVTTAAPLLASTRAFASPVTAPDIFVIAADYAEAAAEARHAGNQGATVIWLDDAIDRHWTELDRALARRPMAIAGITTAPHFFCFQMLAAGRRLALVEQQPASEAHAGAVPHLAWLFRPIALA